MCSGILFLITSSEKQLFEMIEISYLPKELSLCIYREMFDSICEEVG